MFSTKSCWRFVLGLAVSSIALVNEACAAQPPDSQAATEVLRNKGFSDEWIQGLTADDAPRWYDGQELKNIGLPVGGLFAGQLYLGGDGRLWYWDIFNERVLDPGGPGDKFYLKPMRPDDYREVSSGFIVEVDGSARVLDGRGFAKCRFRGEYPIGLVQLADDQSPVDVQLEAFSPFSPTDSRFSSLPATVMCYTLTNSSDKTVNVRVGGWLENAGNRKAVRAGVVKPVTAPVDGAVGVTLSTAQSQVNASARGEIPLEDFERGYGDWVAQGDAFGQSPFVHSERATWQSISGSQGKSLVNTHNTRAADSSVAADQLTGTLTSPEFEVERRFLSFLVAGGSYEGTNAAGGEVNGATAVQVLVDDQVVAVVTGQDTNEHRAVNVDLSDYQGRPARVRIVDSRTGSWGHIQADDFVQTDEPRKVSAVAADTGSMALALLGEDGTVVEPDELPVPWQSELQRIGDAVPDNAGVVRSGELALAPGDSVEVRLAVAWHFANGHLGSIFPGEIQRRSEQRNHYSKFYDNAGDVMAYLAEYHDRLTATTRLWRDTWYDSTLPRWFLDRTFINASTLATTAAFRMHDAEREDLDGRVYFWEGVYLGPGTCTHVTHYEQAFGRLFPDAARTQRQVTDFNAGWDDRLGYVRYRAEWGIGHHFGIPHAIDGHAGTILRTYREHTTSPDNAFLESVWPRVKHATQFLIDQDAGRGFFADKVPPADRNTEPDGILSGPQYNTLDKVWDGTIPWISGMYMSSLRASAEMAREMGDGAFADECTQIVELGERKLVEKTFNKDFGYFVQRPRDQAKYVNSNNGCHIDQMLGDYWARQLGLASPFLQSEGDMALGKILEHNFHRRVGDYQDRSLIKIVRCYAQKDEPGTVMCSFPYGGAKEAAPGETRGWDALVLGYFSESWTGQEYPLAAAMIDRGLVNEGLAVCRAAHDRYAEAPTRRNPFNEVEYGNHYTRAMSSYAAYVSATGFEYHGPKGHIGFAPKLSPTRFRSAFTAAKGWGTYEQRADAKQLTCKLTVNWGEVKLKTVSVVLAGELKGKVVDTVKVQNDIVSTFSQDGDKITVVLDDELHLNAGQSLTIDIGA